MPTNTIIKRAVIMGALAAAALLAIYVGLISAISGWELVKLQFRDNWYFIVSLAIGFGLQVGLYTYLKHALAARRTSSALMAVSGTTSGAAMVACCAHYLVNAAALIGLAGAVSLIAQYQRQLFWVGIFFNLAGLAYLIYRLIQFNAYEPQSSPTRANN